MSSSKQHLNSSNGTAEDQVLPLRFLDSNDAFQRISLDFTLHFDDVLDVEKLRHALERLLQIGKWGQLGARFKKNSKGKLEYHIPQNYDEARPGFVWSHDNRHQSILENPLTSRLPRQTSASGPTIYEDANIFQEFVTRPGRPAKMADWTTTDHPPLSVHVISFTDATLVTLSWPHVFSDAAGIQSLLQAWVAVLEGREEEVASFMPFEEDPIVTIAADAKTSSHVLFSTALTGIWFFLFVIGYIYELVVHSKEASRMVYLPGPWVEALREKATAELLANGASEEEVFLSHGDVILAYWCKLTMTAQHLRPSQPVHIINVMDIRRPLKISPTSGENAYIGNAVDGAVTFTTAAELEKLSVGELAFRVRRDLEKQRAPDQLKAHIAWSRDCYNKSGRFPLAGSWNQIIFSLSNWTRAKFYEVDFSAAVTKAGPDIKERATKLGRPSLLMTTGAVQGLSLRNGGPLLGKDANGNWWITWVLRAGAWSEIEKAFRDENQGMAHEGL